MTEWFYFFIIIFANSIGALSGMGGGVIIKPLFDSLGQHNVSEISFYASLAVFTMSIVTILRQIKQGRKVEIEIALYLILGAIVGGFLGNTLLMHVLDYIHEKLVLLCQIIITILSLLLAFGYSRYGKKQHSLQKPIAYLFAGGLLGLLSSFLGIGGGPLNVPMLIFLFGFPVKQATLYSLVIIFFSQLSKLISIGTSQTWIHYDITPLPVIVIAAIIGGLLGARLSRLLKEEQVNRAFQYTLLLILAINIYNLWTVLSPM